MKQNLLNVTISIILFFLFSELFALGWYFLSSWYTVGHGELFYLSDKPQLSIGEVASEELISDFRLHPYFGFVGKPALVRNNHGFIFPSDYPIKKQNANQYMIGIFGGSVAETFAHQGQARLVERLKQEPFFQEKEIILLNFGLGGYKQPQQLLILNYYLFIGQEMDMVINIDGFNEVALSNINNEHQVDIAMPSSHHLTPLISVIDRTTLTSPKIQALAEINQYKTQANWVAAKMNTAQLAFPYFVFKQAYKIFFNQYARERLAFEQLEDDAAPVSMIYSYPAQSQPDKAVLFHDIALEWVNASLLMNQILKARQIAYFHFLQPNQYYSKKKFSLREATQALNPDQPYRSGVENGYPILMAEAQQLSQNQVNFYNMTEIFDQEAAAIYIDDCCHYNQLGNNLLADFISDAILATKTFD